VPLGSANSKKNLPPGSILQSTRAYPFIARYAAIAISDVVKFLLVPVTLNVIFPDQIYTYKYPSEKDFTIPSVQ